MWHNLSDHEKVKYVDDRDALRPAAVEPDVGPDVALDLKYFVPNGLGDLEYPLDVDEVK